MCADSTSQECINDACCLLLCVFVPPLSRYLIRPSEACSVSVQYQATSTSLHASTRLLLLDVATGQPVPNLHQPSLQLVPSDKGYLLLGLAEPLADVPAGSWAVVVTSDHKLPPLVDVPCSRQAVFGGLYAPNSKAVMARWVGAADMVARACAPYHGGGCACSRNSHRSPGAPCLFAACHDTPLCPTAPLAGLSSPQLQPSTLLSWHASDLQQQIHGLQRCLLILPPALPHSNTAMLLLNHLRCSWAAALQQPQTAAAVTALQPQQAAVTSAP